MTIKLHKEAENPIVLNTEQSKRWGIFHALGLGVHKVNPDEAIIYNDKHQPITQIRRDQIVDFLENHCLVRGKKLNIEVVDELPKLAPGIQLDEIYLNPNIL